MKFNTEYDHAKFELPSNTDFSMNASPNVAMNVGANHIGRGLANNDAKEYSFLNSSASFLRSSSNILNNYMMSVVMMMTMMMIIVVMMTMMMIVVDMIIIIIIIHDL